MPTRRKAADYEKISLRIDRDDLEFLKVQFKNIGYNEAIRRIVGHFVRRLESSATPRDIIADVKLEDISPTNQQ